MSEITAIQGSGRDVAVLTGDLVDSSRYPAEVRGRLHGALTEISKELRDLYTATVPFNLDLFRGDSWQLLVAHPETALRLGLYIRAALRAQLRSSDVDTRVAIGIGTVTFLAPDGVSAGDGPAFRSSGQALDALGRAHRMGFAADIDAARSLDTVLKLVDYPATWWTWRQAQAISQALLDRTQEETAAAWPDGPITQQAVAQHLSRAGWHAVDTAVAFFEDVVSDCVASG